MSFEKDGILINLQAKMSRFAVIKFKRFLRDKYFPGDPNGMALVDKLLVERRIVLVNFSETRSDEQILNNSIYPQLERIRLDMQEAA